MIDVNADLVTYKGKIGPSVLDEDDKSGGADGTVKPLSKKMIDNNILKEELELIRQENEEIKASNQLILDKLNGVIDTQLTGSIVEKVFMEESEVGRYTLDPGESLRIIDDERKTKNNLLLFFRLNQSSEKVRVDFTTRTIESKGFAYVYSLESDDSRYQRMFVGKENVGSVYLVEMRNISDNPLEVYNIILSEID